MTDTRTIRMTEATARRLKIAALLAGQPAGEFLDTLLKHWAEERGLTFVLTEEVIKKL